MLEKIKQNKKSILIALLVFIAIAFSFFIIYKISNALLLVIAGVLLLIIGSFIKDPEKLEVEEKMDNATQLSIFSEEVLEPIILEEEKKEIINEDEEIILVNKKRNKRRKRKEILDIENTNSYNFDNVSMKKAKKA